MDLEVLISVQEEFEIPAEKNKVYINRLRTKEDQKAHPIVRPFFAQNKEDIS